MLNFGKRHLVQGWRKLPASWLGHVDFMLGKQRYQNFKLLKIIKFTWLLGTLKFNFCSSSGYVQLSPNISHLFVTLRSVFVCG